MAFLTVKTQIVFALSAIPFGIAEVFDKLLLPIPNFYYVDVAGILTIIVFSTIFLVWEWNKVVLSHYPVVVALQDLGANYYGIRTGNIDEDGRPIEGALIVMMKRRGIFKNLIRPDKITLRVRQQFIIDFIEGFVNLRAEHSQEKEGSMYKPFTFPTIAMEEEMHSYAFRIRYPKSASNPALSLANFALADYVVRFDYRFGYFRRVSFTASEELNIRGR